MAGHVPETSIEAYRAGLESGQHVRMLDLIHRLLLECTADGKGVTRAEFKEFVNTRLQYRGATEPWVNKLYELKQRGRARILIDQDRECRVTHNPCQVWVGIDAPERPLHRVKGLTDSEMRTILDFLPAIAECAVAHGVPVPPAFQRLADWFAFRLTCDTCGFFPCACAGPAVAPPTQVSTTPVSAPPPPSPEEIFEEEVVDKAVNHLRGLLLGLHHQKKTTELTKTCSWLAVKSKEFAVPAGDR
jgi:hypothetical protein